MGNLTAPTLFSYFGDPKRFPTTRKGQGYVGFYPATDSSGQVERKGTALSKEGPSLLRRDLYLSADHFRRKTLRAPSCTTIRWSTKASITNRRCVSLPIDSLSLGSWRWRGSSGPISYGISKEIPSPRNRRGRLRLSFVCQRRCGPGCEVSRKKKNRESVSSPVTSEHEAPRSETAPRQEDSTKERVTLTKAEVAMLVDQLSKSGGNLEEINIGFFK